METQLLFTMTGQFIILFWKIVARFYKILKKIFLRESSSKFTKSRAYISITLQDPIISTSYNLLCDNSKISFHLEVAKMKFSLRGCLDIKI